MQLLVVLVEEVNVAAEFCFQIEAVWVCQQLVTRHILRLDDIFIK